MVAYSEPVCIQQFRGQPTIDRAESPGHQRIVEPIMVVDEVNVVAWPQDPAVARLPPQYPALRVVLDVVDPGHERAELQFGDGAIQTRVEASFRKLHLVPFSGQR